MKVKEVAKITGLSRRTLQYYDEIDLMRPSRSVLNYRLYTEEDLDRLWQIQVYKEMGFQLSEIRRLLKVNDEQRAWLLNKKLQHINVKISDLEREYNFIKKVRDNGIPERMAVAHCDSSKTYRELAKLLAERID